MSRLKNTSIVRTKEEIHYTLTIQEWTRQGGGRGSAMTQEQVWYFTEDNKALALASLAEETKVHDVFGFEAGVVYPFGYEHPQLSSPLQANIATVDHSVQMYLVLTEVK